jgi:hypothetical protein
MAGVDGHGGIIRAPAVLLTPVWVHQVAVKAVGAAAQTTIRRFHRMI